MKLQLYLVSAIAWSTSYALSLDLQSAASVNNALALVAEGLMDYYPGDKYGGTPGMMVNPYYWWEAGAAWSAMIDYWFYTGNTTYNDAVKEALLFQVGNDKDYMPANQTTSEGNDDQGFWGLAVMNAAEKNFSNPSPDEPQWLYLGQSVWSTMQARWDTANCNGGLRWQIYSFNAGYDYKNTVSNGCFFTIGARLARYTGNSTYVDWCEKIWDWMTNVTFIDSSYQVVDGASITTSCETHTNLEWSYNYGLMLAGCAYLYSYTNDTIWEDRATGLFKAASSLFFTNGIMYEQACQPRGTCNTDQRCFKGIFSRFLGSTALLIPSLTDEILALLQTSAVGAANSCSGGTDGHTCGLNWQTGSYDGIYGLGEQICALEAIQNNLVTQKAKPLTNNTGGSSSLQQGTASTDSGSTINNRVIYTKDKAGAAIVTVLCLGAILGTGFWMLR